jgi:hydroxyacylglutathione hydrolase
MKRIPLFFFVFTFFLQIGCTTVEDFTVLYQVSGPGETNSYLIYGVKSKEAALIDPGGQIDTLITFIKDNALDIKYIFVTHGHVDHIFGIQDVKKQFPKAKLCMHKDDYRDIFTALKWATDNYGMEWIETVRSNPETRKLLDFDMNSIGVPNIFVEDNQTFKLGFLEIKTIHTPGHSPGGICYYTGNILFSGDVLFYRTVGRTDTQNGSREDQIKSVRKLYQLFPDSTIVYPGHGQFTDIGSEKKENTRITVDGGAWDVK